jgi:hypothetical protein
MFLKNDMKNQMLKVRELYPKISKCRLSFRSIGSFMNL